MTPEPPELPDGDDPYELLGVDRGVDEKTLKRAYHRLARQFKPEHAPEEFRRIREAYEVILPWVRERVAHVDPLVFPSMGQPSPDAEGADDPEPATSAEHALVQRAWRLVEEGDIESAADTLERGLDDSPESGALYLHRFLLAELAGESAPSSWLVAGLRSSPWIGAELLSFLDEEELRELLARADCSWEAALSGQQPRFTRWALLKLRLESLIERGDLDALLRDVRADSFAVLAVGDDRFADLAHKVACAVALERPKEALRIEREFPRDLTRAETHESELALEKSRVAGVWQSWSKSHTDIAPLRRLIEVNGTLPYERMEPLRRDLQAACLAEPVKYLNAFSSLRHQRDALVFVAMSALGGPFVPAGSPGDLITTQAGYVNEDLAGATRAPSGGCMLPVFLLLLFALRSLPWTPWYYAATWAGLFIVSALIYGAFTAKRDFTPATRLTLAQAISASGVSSRSLLAAASEARYKCRTLLRFRSFIEKDLALDMYYLAVTAGGPADLEDETDWD